MKTCIWSAPFSDWY